MANLTLHIKLDRFWQIALLIIILRALSGPTGLLAYVLIAFYGLRSPRHTVEAIILSYFLTLANPAIFGGVAGGGIGRYIVIFCLAGATIGRLLLKQQLRINHIVLATLIMGSFIVLHGILFSVLPSISVLKGLLWSLAMLTVLLSFSKLSEREFLLAEGHIYSFLGFLVAFSLLAYVLVPAGTMLPYTYLRGVLAHSQATGVMAAMLSVWAFSRMLTSIKKNVWDVVLFAGSFLTVFLSGTRTGLVSVALCVVALMLVAGSQSGHPVRQLLRKARNPLVGLGLAAIALMAIMHGGTLLTAVSDFMSKNKEIDTLTSAYVTSRGGLIEIMLANILADPLVGLGFGIASEPGSMIVQTVAGVPISAVVEKGVTHIAVLEELGLIGTLFFLYWIVLIFYNSIKAQLAQFGLVLSIVLLNFGEAALFYAGGSGLLQILLIGYASYRVSRARSAGPSQFSSARASEAPRT
jgi:hypothetical protein